MFYDVLSRIGVFIEVLIVFKFFREIFNIKVIKEVFGFLKRVIELYYYEKDFKIFSGEDLFNYFIMFLGGCGVILVIGNLMFNLIL